MFADMMNMQAREELNEERISLLEKAIEKVLKYDDRLEKNAIYSFDHHILFDILREALDREREIKI